MNITLTSDHTFWEIIMCWGRLSKGGRLQIIITLKPLYYKIFMLHALKSLWSAKCMLLLENLCCPHAYSEKAPFETDIAPLNLCFPWADKGALWMNILMALLDRKSTLLSFLIREVRYLSFLKVSYYGKSTIFITLKYYFSGNSTLAS